MSSSKFILFFPALLASFYLESSLHAQEKFKKIRVTYPTESIAVLPLFAAYRWKTFEDNDLQSGNHSGSIAGRQRGVGERRDRVFRRCGPGFGERDSERTSVARGLVRQRRDYLLAARPG